MAPFQMANSQGCQPWPEEALRVLSGASADLPRITLVPAGLRLLSPACGWLLANITMTRVGPF